ncbi:hypothetical protein IGI04_025288 [Brassica rapa subsp. trilocularis]|uniref:Uncharacterized protein n=1 Tax=Brassica rapa subsp. trilocularis TaxID=1813537 RepID=A0ABQ7M976_BRACM|nr:hypothetical protein IGI04_025288 [Brassica rapa subsp. trilocularis]
MAASASPIKAIDNLHPCIANHQKTGRGCIGSISFLWNLKHVLALVCYNIESGLARCSQEKCG